MSRCLPAAGGGGRLRRLPSVETIAPLLPLVAIALVFWLLLVRPASRRQKDVARLQASLVPGDRVMLASGIFATLQSVEEDTVMAQIADGVVVQVARGAISVVEQRSDAAPDDLS